MPNRSFVKSGGLLFLEQSIVSFGGSIFWLIVSQLVFASEIGEAVTVLSFVMITTTLIGMGIEYPLLKNSSNNPQVVTTALVIESIISLLSIPIFILIFKDVLHFSSEGIFFIAIGLLITTPLGNVLRYYILGKSMVKNVLIIFVSATMIKIVSVFVLLSYEFGALGILLSFLFFAVFVLIVSFFNMFKEISLNLKRMEPIWPVLKISLANAPSKIRPITRHLVVFLLPIFHFEESEIGVFFMALVISWVIGSLSTSLAQMVIPASSKSNTDLSAESMRISLGLTSPLIVAIMIAPGTILSIIGSEYYVAANSLFVLLVSIIPFIVTVNSISRFNNLNQTKEIIIIGLVQTYVLIAAFVFLIQDYGILGAAFAVLISSSVSATLCLILSGWKQFRFSLVAIFSVSTGWVIGYAINSISMVYLPLSIPIGMGVSFLIILGFKIISISEIRSALKIQKK